jgi:hypothetical protein
MWMTVIFVDCCVAIQLRMMQALMGLLLSIACMGPVPRRIRNLTITGEFA